MLYPVKVTSPDGKLVKTVTGDGLFIYDAKYPPKKPAQKMPFELVTCKYCGDKIRVRVSVRGIVRKTCKKTECEYLAEKASKESKLKLQRGLNGR